MRSPWSESLLPRKGLSEVLQDPISEVWEKEGGGVVGSWNSYPQWPSQGLPEFLGAGRWDNTVEPGVDHQDVFRITP